MCTTWRLQQDTIAEDDMTGETSIYRQLLCGICHHDIQLDDQRHWEHSLEHTTLCHLPAA
jgi:hypothetical protein